MKYLLIMIIFYSVNPAKTGYSKRYFEISREKAGDKNNKLLMFQKTQKDLKFNNKDSKKIRSISEAERNYEQNKRYPYSYWHHKRANPSFRRQIIPMRDVNNVYFSKYRHNIGKLDLSHAGTYRISNEIQESPAKYHISKREKNNNIDGVFLKDASQLNPNVPSKKQRKMYATKSISFDSTLTSNNKDSVDTHLSNQKYSEVVSKKREIKRDIIRNKDSSESPIERLYQSLSQFYIIYLLLFLFLFVPLVSVVLFVIIPVSSFCWSSCKKQDRGDTSQHDLKNIELKTVIVDDTPAVIRPVKDSKSFKNIIGNFVTNEINGEGDTVGKRMKLERWIMQGGEQRTHHRSKRHRNYAIDMESLAEEPSEIESTFEHSGQSGISSMKNSDLMPLCDRKKNMKASTSKTKKQQAFRFPDETVTVRRIPDHRYTNPRNIFSLIHQPVRFIKRATQSMIEITH